MDVLLNSLSYVFWVVLALGILVFVHELGHFLAARLFGMRVDAFSLGFPPNIFKRKVGQTEYRIGAVPLGGYVKIAGMVDESLDASGVVSEPQPDEYRAKPVWQRVVVITAGVVFNLVLAGLIFIGLAMAYGRAYTPAENVRLEVLEGSIAHEMGLRSGDRVVAVGGQPIVAFEEVLDPSALARTPYTVTVERDGEEVTLTGPEQLMTRLSRAQRALGDDAGLAEIFGAGPRLPAVLGGVVAGSAAAEAGLRAGDRIVALGETPIDSWNDITRAVQASGGEPMRVVWERPDSLVAAGDPAPVARADGVARFEGTITPRASGERYLLGVQNAPDALGVRYERLGPLEAVEAGVERAVASTTLYVAVVGRLFTGRENFRENVGGPLMIAKQTKEAADRGADAFWVFVAMLSIALAVFNILPIPALDGGHLMFLLYEAIARREPSLKVRIAVQQVGMVLILALMAFVIFNDAARWFG
ncbi:MAG: RIP metalloprotease RseP [Rubricoccaceae bacterium]